MWSKDARVYPVFRGVKTALSAPLFYALITRLFYYKEMPIHIYIYVFTPACSLSKRCLIFSKYLITQIVEKKSCCFFANQNY